jgi:hypothetical protein
MEMAERGGRLLRSLARGLTSTLMTGREQVGAMLEDASRAAGGAVDQLRDAGDDMLARINPAPLVEDLYALLGIASASAMADLDERIDYVELKVEEVARKRAREELMLLQQRISELESVIAQVGDNDRHQTMHTLLLRLAELESRIDALPWTRFVEEQRPRQ